MSANTEIRKGWCGPCHLRCGMLVHFEDGRAVSVQGDPANPLNRGALCRRGQLILEHLHNPARLNYPLKKAAQRGAGKWQQITWDQAMDEIAGKLGKLRDRFGSETLAFSRGTYRTYGWAMKRFLNLFGSPNMIGANTICMCPSHTVEWSTCGSFARQDIGNAACVVIWGFQPSESRIIPDWRDLLAAKNRGAKIIVVDPRRTKEAEMADLWLQVRPGTDVALMLGWLKIILDENLYDREFVEKWTVGFEPLRKHLGQRSLDQLARICWVPEEKIKAASRMYAGTKPAVITWGLGIDLQGVNAMQAVRARCILRAVTGNIDVPGGELLGISGDEAKLISNQAMELNDAISAEQKKKQLGAGEYGLFGFPGWDAIRAVTDRPGAYFQPPQSEMTCCAHPRHVWQAILTGKPYPVKAFISQSNNTLVQAPDPKTVHAALSSDNLDLSVAMDYYLTPTAELADYVLPAASTLERSDFPAYPKAMDPLYERRDDYQFWRELGIRLGQAEHWPWRTSEEVCDYRFSPLGITFSEALARGGIRPAREFRKYESQGFGTSSGKVEIFSSIFERFGLEPLPVYREPVESPAGNPELARDYPLILIASGKFMPFYHSELRQIPSAIRDHPDPVTDIHPETAQGLGITDNDWIFIETVRGKIKQRARLTDEVHPAMVRVQHGWWFPDRPAAEPSLHGVWESNSNVLCPTGAEYCNPEVGGWPHTGLLCRVYAAAKAS
ncbi:MAG TPA: molybdopterin-dependent oxidoreductase [Acidobacteriota bacterium]|nr:molybdopterin-dependent oxidoreductase [Acidobacteriota bacterium]